MVKISKFAGLGALALLATTPAQALVLNSNTTTGGSVFVTVWDPIKSVSVVQDLGLTFSSFATLGSPQSVVAGAFTPQSFAIDFSVFTTAGSALSDLRWNVFAGDSAGLATAKGVLVTSLNPFTGIKTTQINGMNTNATALTTAFNQNCPSAATCTQYDAYDPNLWGESYGGQFAPLNDAGLGESLGFYLVNSGGLNADTDAIVTQFANVSGSWNWALDQSGALTFAASAAPVPLPAAVWLLLSGLLGVGALGRRPTEKA